MAIQRDGGVVRDSFAAGDAVVNAIALEPNGAILVAGSLRSDDDFVTRPALARYGPDGTPDPRFGNQPTGEILLGGLAARRGDFDFAVARYLGRSAAR